ncbi:TonB-dependent receptor plug [Methylomonas methanica MC09]|uniref:TonB-dependent receptor plug n=1 Tax=Methylomonas methanica (strain DSM 25384 / MC09) TaxID=857087 RepID=F9ZW01_METMM|nr:TonB-dependent receptor plug [Methylomonas methanica MC09]
MAIAVLALFRRLTRKRCNLVFTLLPYHLSIAWAGALVESPPIATAVKSVPVLEADVDEAAKPGQTPPSAETAKDLADMDITELVNVKVSPFEVSSQLDSGYKASNSVSGSRFDTPIRDLPFAIQSFTASFIKDQKPRDIFDVARYSPGVTYRSNDFNEGNANLAIRGFAVGSLAGGNIQVLRDGVHGPSIFDFTNIARVEVVKGPSSFLYGQVAPGGIVNVITKNPQRQFAANADARYGAYGQHRFDVDVTGPATSTLAYRFAASYDQDIDYWKPYDAHTWNISPSILWQPSDRLSVTFKYENFQKIEEPQLMQKPGRNTQNGVVPTATDPNLVGVDVPGLANNWNSMAYSDYRNSNTHNLSTWIDFRANEHWNLRSGFSHLEYEVDALFTGNFGMANNTTLMQGRRVRQQVYSNRDDSIELQAVGKYDLGFASLRLLLGGQYVDRYFARKAGQAPNDPALGNVPTASPLPLWDLSNPATWNRDTGIPFSLLTESALDQRINYVDKSVYGGSTLGFFNDRLLVLTGWRWTSTESQVNDRATGIAQSTASRVTPQFGMLYKLTPELSLFGSYAESFVPGTFPINNIDGSSSIPAPTEGWGYDIGLKASLFDGRVSGTLTFFDIRNRNIVNDLAQTNALGAVVINNIQSGEQRSRGIELDTTIKVTDNWQLYTSYSYMDARITEFSGQDAAILAQDPNTLDAAGQANYKNINLFHNARLQMSAPHIANLWTRYDFTQEGFAGLYLAGGVNFVYDQTLLPNSPASSRQTYALINASVGYAWEAAGHRMSLDLMGKNLVDEQYRPSQSTRSRPREFLFTFSVNY